MRYRYSATLPMSFGFDNPRNTLRLKLLQLISVRLWIILFGLRTANTGPWCWPCLSEKWKHPRGMACRSGPFRVGSVVLLVLSHKATWNRCGGLLLEISLFRWVPPPLFSLEWWGLYMVRVVWLPAVCRWKESIVSVSMGRNRHLVVLG
jgi:hypothetical protein